MNACRDIMAWPVESRLLCRVIDVRHNSFQVRSAQVRYEVGLEKLAFTAQQVEVMRVDLRALQPVVGSGQRGQGAYGAVWDGRGWCGQHAVCCGQKSVYPHPSLSQQLNITFCHSLLRLQLEKTVAETDALLARVAHEKTAVVEPKKLIVDEEVKQVGVSLYLVPKHCLKVTVHLCNHCGAKYYSRLTPAASGGCVCVGSQRDEVRM